MTFRAARRMGAMVLVAVIIPACHFTGTAPTFFDPFPPSTANAVLSGSQVVPAVTTAATGTGTLVIDGMQTSIAYTISATGLGTVTAVRIHVGAAGTNGSAMFTIATAPFTSPLTGTLTSVNFTPVPGTSNFGSAVARILSGDAYLVITTVANPAGEIR